MRQLVHQTGAPRPLCQLDQVAVGDLVTRVNELTTQNQRLSDGLAAAKHATAELEAQLTEAQDDLAAARGSLRKMIRAENHGGAT
ncbi:hypothetical protein [Streptomyces sp. NBC_00536]|uniref:hypothetical protein n=1 Tax=Streptomyces sp. NBC_00536 TaxID=2975769 RepID=UPI002E7FB4AA|nr:hypothetical protein [Streptomyces sp. NBC_00536]